MEQRSLIGFADASGNDVSPTDKILTVNGCLSTPEKWEDFDAEWQDYLRREHFKPDPTTGTYVFHTSSFHTGNFKLMPSGLTKHARARIYENLIGIICKYTLYRFGFGIHLDSLRQVEEEYPYSRTAFFKQPGTYASAECFRWNSIWAEDHGYNPSIAYIFDRGDAFWGELYEQYRSTQKLIDPEQRTVASLSQGNKADFSPLQAADIVAWECRNYSLSLSAYNLTGAMLPKWPRVELNRLLAPGINHANIRLYTRDHLISGLHDYYEEFLEENGKDFEYVGVGDGKVFANIDGFIRSLLEFTEEADLKEKRDLLQAWKARKKR